MWQDEIHSRTVKEASILLLERYTELRNIPGFLEPSNHPESCRLTSLTGTPFKVSDDIFNQPMCIYISLAFINFSRAFNRALPILLPHKSAQYKVSGSTPTVSLGGSVFSVFRSHFQFMREYLRIPRLVFP